MDQAERGARFRALHEGPPFVLPNPWDAGSARVLEGLGFRALATTSSGLAFGLGRTDGEATLDEVLAHVRAVVAATDLPVSVDLEDGHGPEPEATAAAVRAAAAAGAVGGSIEDWDRSGRLHDREQAVTRVAAAVQAARALPFPFTLTARAEGFIRDAPDLDEVVARLAAFEAAGADVLYAPGIPVPDGIAALRARTERPLNVLAMPGDDLATLVAAGAQRVSVGGALTWVAVDAMAGAARRIAEAGDFSGLVSGGSAAIEALLPAGPPAAPPPAGVTFVAVIDVPAGGVEDLLAYEAAVLPLLPEHGGTLERRLRSADGTAEVHTLRFASRAAFAAYRDDPRRAGQQERLERSGARLRVLEVADHG